MCGWIVKALEKLSVDGDEQVDRGGQSKTEWMKYIATFKFEIFLLRFKNYI